MREIRVEEQNKNGALLSHLQTVLKCAKLVMKYMEGLLNILVVLSQFLLVDKRSAGALRNRNVKTRRSRPTP